jgi:transposase InsO family protein
MATDNPLWGQERIANELLLKLAIRVSPRTVSKYMPKQPPGRPRGDQRWSTFVRNHAKAIVACDFFVTVTATFRLLYVFVMIEHGSRRLLHLNVTAHPTAAWTLQQLREILGHDVGHRYLIHDRDSIFARSLDESIKNLGLTVLKSPPHSPKANAICERVIRTIRRECLDWLIPLSELHLRSILKAWVGHYNRGRPHMALGPGVPDPPPEFARPATSLSRHRIGERLVVRARSLLGGLHHEYCWRPQSPDRVFAEHSGLRFATLPLLEAFLCQSDIFNGCLLGLLDEPMQQHHLPALDCEQCPRDTMGQRRPNLPDGSSQVIDTRLAYRPLELKRRRGAEWLAEARQRSPELQLSG